MRYAEASIHAGVIAHMKILFLFIDGVGIRPAAKDNPVHAGTCPTLCRLMEKNSVAIDACLDMPGLPQSATGQTTMFTGVNASKHMGRHCEGFPGPTLRKLITDDNLFMMLARSGKRCRFADAYLVDNVDDIRVRRFKSVTTVMALTQPESISIQDDLQVNLAVSHDITRGTLQEKGHDIPAIQPREAAEHLLQIARANDFTLFEMFVTDLAGHSGNYDEAVAVLATLDAFLEALVALFRDTNILVVLTSDHGNIENMTERGHTRNPVPLIAFGAQADEFLKEMNGLMDITPRIVQMMTQEKES